MNKFIDRRIYPPSFEIATVLSKMSSLRRLVVRVALRHYPNDVNGTNAFEDGWMEIFDSLREKQLSIEIKVPWFSDNLIARRAQYGLQGIEIIGLGDIQIISDRH